jgi:hypothetical protein
MNSRSIITGAAAVGLSLASSCTRVRVDPIEVKTIHIVHDINIKVDRELDEFFAFQERAATQPAASSPATTQTADNPGGVQ